MKRKIVEQGLSKTKVVSLPIKWARKYGLEKGDEVIVEEAGPKLILTTPKTLKYKEVISFPQALLEPYEMRILGKMYMAGYDHIELTDIHNKKSATEMKQEISRALLGLAVVEESKEKIVLESVVAETEEQFLAYEQKVFQTALQYAKAVREAIANRQYGDLEDTENLEFANNRFAAYCERYLNKKGLKNYAFTYLSLWCMEKVADEYKYLLKHAQKHNVKASPALLAYYDKTIAFVEDMHKLYQKFDVEFNMALYSSVIKRKASLTDSGEDLLVKESKLAHHLLNVVSISFDMLGNIAARAYSR